MSDVNRANIGLIALAVALGIAALVATGIWFWPSEFRIPRGAEVEVLWVDPDVYREFGYSREGAPRPLEVIADKVKHRTGVLAATTLSAQEQSELSDLLESELARVADGKACFEPRHIVCVRSKDTARLERVYLICLECNRYVIYGAADEQQDTRTFEVQPEFKRWFSSKLTSVQ